ncbi:hypothetical protein [Lysinibacillus odysseyi]|uniref:Transcriptional regulator n=1 Tax=Lysinibacillus odysseyi 34hs-1 = NBRC 100172 TaxID=1220589 RepID=A0A0A3IFU4_9BACI|nr:hypothetical protein [Lysinibacillus odysseyi]KGR81693.1 hypothetical protein CD32_20320 [Lysinibacillus odysseyi 34hs-1 = NBRC 100172]
MLKVGFIGPLWIEKTIKRCFAMFPHLEVQYLLSDEIYDALAFTRELAEEVDCLLYSSRATYQLVQQSMKLHIESYYIPLKGAGLYEALFHLTRNRDIRFISIDGISEQYIETAMSSIDGISFESFEYFNSFMELDRIIQRHLEVKGEKNNFGVITSLKKVEEALARVGIPVVWLKPTKEDIIVCIERMMLSSSQRRQRENQIVFGKLTTISPINESLTQKQRLLRKEKLERDLYSYIEEMNGHIFRMSDQEYHFIVQRGEFERVTEGYKVLNILKEIKNIKNHMLHIGIGFGISIPSAVFHADLAHRQCQQYAANTAFIVNEKRHVIGPLELQAPTVYQLNGPSEKGKFKIKQIELLKMYVAKNELNHFTSDEVANVLKVTKRTANRIISGWIDNGIVEWSGLEKVNDRGRPRQCYKFRGD